jgi:hypothetical protein
MLFTHGLSRSTPPPMLPSPLILNRDTLQCSTFFSKALVNSSARSTMTPPPGDPFPHKRRGRLRKALQSRPRRSVLGLQRVLRYVTQPAEAADSMQRRMPDGLVLHVGNLMLLKSCTVRCAPVARDNASTRRTQTQSLDFRSRQSS